VTDNTAASFPSSGFGDLSGTTSTVVNVLVPSDPVCSCVSDLVARAKPGKVQLVWTHTGAHHYNVYRGTVSGGPYLKIASTTSTYCTYLDHTVVNGMTYYYVVREANLINTEECQSNQASARPKIR
jgi:fibronectin type 3 domain-containing protein